MSLPLSKTLDPERDYADLAEELVIVDQYFTSAREQHPHRRFEYAMGLRALATHYPHFPGCQNEDVHVIYDVGGAGSPFTAILEGRPHRAYSQQPVRIIDPETTVALKQFVYQNPTLADVVFCLSVIEHVDDLDQFLYHLSCLVAPGGLLFLTMDCCECGSHAADMEVGDPLDRHHFHWMRQRMFGRADLRHVAETLLDHSFAWLGDRDLTYHGDHVYDYSFASLALVKRA